MVSDLDELLRGLTPERIAALDRETQEQVLAYVNARAQAKRRIPLATWTPHPKQDAFIRSPKRVRIMLGGNRSGKTWVGTAEALAHALGYRPWQVPELCLTDTDPRAFPPREQVPAEAWVRRADGVPIAVPNSGIIVSGQGLGRGIGPTIWPRIRELWPAEVPLQSWHGPQGTPVRLQLPNGSVIYLASSTQDRFTFEGTAYMWVYADEPVPSYVFNGLWRGLTDSYGSIWFTQTPLGALSRWLHTGLIQDQALDVFMIKVAQRDNPALEEKAVEEFEATSTWTEEERRARLFGDFEFLSDTVWPQFRASHHVVEPFAIPPSWPRGCTEDPHLRKPWAMVWWVLDPIGRVYFYREWPKGDFRRMRNASETPADYALIIRSEEGQDRIMFRFLDPNFGRNPVVATKQGMRTIQAELASYGLEFTCKINDDVDYGIGAVADALRCDLKKPSVGDNQPKIQVFATCRNTIAAMENFAYLPQKSDIRQNVLLSEEFKDFADCVRYTVVGPKTITSEPFSYLAEEDLRRWMQE